MQGTHAFSLLRIEHPLEGFAPSAAWALSAASMLVQIRIGSGVARIWWIVQPGLRKLLGVTCSVCVACP